MLLGLGKRSILRELIRCGEIAFSVVGDISKAHRRYKHQESEHGFMGCHTFGLSPASYWWTRPLGPGISL